MNFLPHYGTTEGPLGFPMLDKQALALDALLKTLPQTPEHAYRKTVLTKAPTELNPGERRLFVASENPVPIDATISLQQQAQDLKFGIITINEIRADRGLEPVPWGNVPWLPLQWAPTDYSGRAEWPAPEIGRNRPTNPAEEAG
jgi:hypothetical protein